ncbi:MAG: hypothetical protein ABSG67_01465 [Thermoguttaceae bacterium]|jgi:hypothetical protein
MSKRVGRHTIEHWRDGELLEKVELTADIIQRHEDGTACVVIPAGFIELATSDQLRFNCDGLIDLLGENPQ